MNKAKIFSAFYRMKKRNVIIKSGFIILLLTVCTIVLSASNPRFNNINSMYGISMRETNSVCKDHNGFIWVSSKTGILRLTDDDCRIYQIPYETANVITVKLVYQDSKLLAYTNNGQLFSYNKISDRFDLEVNMGRVLNDSDLSVNSVILEKNNSLWIASSNGLYRYHNEELSLIGGNNLTVHRLLWYNDHQFFFARGGEFSLFNTHTRHFTSFYNYTKNPAFEVTKFFFDRSKNKLWIGSISDGLFSYDMQSKVFSDLKIKSFPKQPILAIESNSDSTLLVGIDGQGIWELDKNREKVLNIFKENVNNPSSLHGNGVYDIFCDNNSCVWICTYSGGVSYFKQASPFIWEITHQPNNVNSLVNNDVNCIIEDSRANIWFATNNGVSCWNRANNKWRNFYENNQEYAQVFLTLCEDEQGRIWAGTYSSGVYVLEGNTGMELAHYSAKEENSSFQNDFVFDIYKDCQGDIWIGGINHEVVCYKTQTNEFKKYTNQALYIFTELSPGQIIFGCTNGLFLTNKRTGEIKTLIDKYLIYDLLVMDNIAWICTSGDGLIQYDLKTNQIEKYTIESGFPSNFVNSITYSKGYLWLGTERGLCRLDLKDESILAFSSLMTLSNVSFNKSSHYALKDGNLILGSNKGAIIFDPSLIPVLQADGRIYYQDLKISGRSIRDSSIFELKCPVDSLNELFLNYFQNTITLELLPLGVSASGSGYKFSWKLEGVDDKWGLPSNNRILTYTNIPTGDFVLKVRMYDNSLSKVIDEKSIDLHIIPPFWKKWWFKVLVLIFIIGIIAIIFTFYIDRLKKQHVEEKNRFFTNTVHDIRTSLTLISGPIEELNKESDLSDLGLYYLHLATEQVRRLFSVVTQLMDFQKVDVGKQKLTLAMIDIVKIINNRIVMFESYAKSRDIKLIFSTNQSIYITASDETMIEKVLDNLISNAIKYSFPNSKIEIELVCNQKKWILEIRDYGIGISKKAKHQLFKEFYRGENAVNSKIVGSGLGLLLVKNYVSLYGGTISCFSHENAGSTFRVVIPYRENSGDIQKVKSENKPVFMPYFPKDIILCSEKQENKASVSKIRILVVEDHDDLRNFLKSVLGDEFDVSLAEDGILAWEIIQKHAPDLVVSDILMPNMDGFSLCKKIKSTYETSHIPIILLTALSEKTQKLQGLGLGADDYLTKPFDVLLLQQRIKTIITNRQAIQEKALKLINVKNNEPIFENELNDKFVKKMVEVVRANISNSEFNKDEFASAMNVSPSLLYKKVKTLTDQSPTDFIKTIRLNHALELLETRKYTITEVSELCGFSSVGYFSTVFRKHFGKSPSQALFTQSN